MSVDRYRKQTLFSELGEAGQAKLAAARVLIVGCGALGSVLAETVVRAGFGFVRLVDRDFVELSNLQRQVLFDEQDIADQLPKAIAAARKLAKINSEVTIEPHVVDVDHTNIRSLSDGVDLILDGTDNFEVRFLINDVALETGTPWVNGGVVGANGQVLLIVPGSTPCLRCLIQDVPEPGTSETCDTAGVIGPAVNVVASLQVVEAMKWLARSRTTNATASEGDSSERIESVLTVIDVWEGTFRRLKLGSDLPERTNCPACRGGERLWLSGERSSQSTVLCGRNAVQISPSQRGTLDLAQLAKKLGASGRVTVNPFLLRLIVPASTPGNVTTGTVDSGNGVSVEEVANSLGKHSPEADRTPAEYEITLFRDGRTIIKGTEDLTTARTLHARYIGH
ncbi:MAG: ThiF family adenylyltransferase [Planctomycetaceae bacterium]